MGEGNRKRKQGQRERTEGKKEREDEDGEGGGGTEGQRRCVQGLTDRERGRNRAVHLNHWLQVEFCTKQSTGKSFPTLLRFDCLNK